MLWILSCRIRRLKIQKPKNYIMYTIFSLKKRKRLLKTMIFKKSLKMNNFLKFDTFLRKRQDVISKNIFLGMHSFVAKILYNDMHTYHPFLCRSLTLKFLKEIFMLFFFLTSPFVLFALFKILLKGF